MSRTIFSLEAFGQDEELAWRLHLPRMAASDAAQLLGVDPSKLKGGSFLLDAGQANAAIAFAPGLVIDNLNDFDVYLGETALVLTPLSEAERRAIRALDSSGSMQVGKAVTPDERS